MEIKGLPLFEINPFMKLRNILTILMISAGVMTVSAQTSSLTSKAHNAAHQHLLAKAKSSQLDKSVIKDFIMKDVERREESQLGVNHISAATQQLVNDLLTEAGRHTGKRYRRGAKGPNAFDCSGFSSYVFRQFGYNLSASSREQFTQGEKIDRKELRKGDLVFFTGRNSRSKTVGHVGIVVSADNETGSFSFIHASTSQGIRIDSNDGYYSKRYIGARRVITE